MLQKAISLLKQTFGFNSFRPLQEKVISAVLDKKDSLVIMPTGGGKSLCYQIPAQVFDGVTLVVSPLISLMKDQVEQLQQFGIPANFLNSSLSPSQYDANISDIRSGKTKLVYLAPETLLQDRIANLLLDGLQIDCITIDEAHCISEWGHDFRPEYRQIAQFRKRFPKAVCVALTATATPAVRQDIINSLELSDSQVFIDSFDRPNLKLNIIPKSQGAQQVVDYIRQNKGKAGIIYCFSRAQVDELTNIINAAGFRALPYHAGLSDKDRNSNQDAFIKDDAEIIVATIAFGMGINKPDVRYVIHFDLPKNIESYYQQIGRAGRDGLPSECVLLYNYGDTKKIEFFIQQKEGQEKELAEFHLKQLLIFIDSYECRRIPLLNYFGETYSKQECKNCDNCLRTDNESQNLTVPAQKFLSCMIRTNEIYGSIYLSDILTGSKSKKILDNRHNELSTYGIGKEFKKEQWKSLSDQLLRKQIILKDEQFGSLKITTDAKPILKGVKEFWGFIPEVSSTTKSNLFSRRTAKEKARSTEYDEVLFQELRTLRKELADKKGIPPFAIFHDSTLAEMCREFPTSHLMMLEISGIGEKKATEYGELFSDIIKSYMKRNNLTPNQPNQKIEIKDSKTPKHLIVSEAFLNGETVKEIAERFDNAESTIIAHLLKFVEQGEYIEPEFIIRETNLEESEISLIKNEFQTSSEGHLKPIFDFFGGKYSYNQLRLVQILLISHLE